MEDGNNSLNQNLSYQEESVVIRNILNSILRLYENLQSTKKELNHDSTCVKLEEAIAEVNNQGINWRNNQISSPEMRWIVESTRNKMGVSL